MRTISSTLLVCSSLSLSAYPSDCLGTACWIIEFMRTGRCWLRAPVCPAAVLFMFTTLPAFAAASYVPSIVLERPLFAR